MLEDYPKEVVAKDGTPILIRPVVKEDEDALGRFFAGIPEHERWFLRDDMDQPAVLKEWIDTLDYSRVLPMVAVNADDGKLLANLRLYRRPSACMRHVAHLRVLVDPAHRHQRIGTWMLLDIIKLAMDMDLEKLAAEFVVGVEDPGVSAARKLDFFEQAVLKDYVKDPGGVSHDLIVMVKDLHVQWSDF
jgi:GNAT superfamily N-acetyltransferase